MFKVFLDGILELVRQVILLWEVSFQHLCNDECNTSLNELSGIPRFTFLYILRYLVDASGEQTLVPIYSLSGTNPKKLQPPPYATRSAHRRL